VDKPKIGDKVRLVGEEIDSIFDVGRVFEVHDSINEWWDTAHGEDKMGLMDSLEMYGPKKAATAKWYAIVENVEYPAETMAVASFECEPFAE